MSQENQFTEQQLFDQLISSLVHSTWVFLGKIKNPVSDSLERDLTQASVQIDMLNMLYKRMKENLTENEDQYLSHLISELKMNFVEEKNKADDGQDSSEKHEKKPEEETTNDTEAEETNREEEKS